MTFEVLPLGWMVAIQFLFGALGWALFGVLVRSERPVLLHWSGFLLLLGLGFTLSTQRAAAPGWVPYEGANLVFLSA